MSFLCKANGVGGWGGRALTKEVQRGMKSVPPKHEWREAQQQLGENLWGNNEKRESTSISAAAALLQAKASLQIH